MERDLVLQSSSKCNGLQALPELRNLFQFEIGKQQIWMKNFHSYLHYNGHCLMGKCTTSLMFLDVQAHAAKKLRSGSEEEEKEVWKNKQ